MSTSRRAGTSISPMRYTLLSPRAIMTGGASMDPSSEVRASLDGEIEDVGRQRPASEPVIEDAAAFCRAAEAEPTFRIDCKRAIGARSDERSAVEALCQLVPFLLVHGVLLLGCPMRGSCLRRSARRAP